MKYQHFNGWSWHPFKSSFNSNYLQTNLNVNVLFILLLKNNVSYTVLSRGQAGIFLIILKCQTLMWGNFEWDSVNYTADSIKALSYAVRMLCRQQYTV